MHITGPYLEGRGSFTPVMHELTGPEDARRMVNFWADEGATSFKAYMNITRDELRAAVEEAHKRNLKVTGHLCSIGFREAAELGIDNLEHGLLVDSEFVPDKQPDKCPAAARFKPVCANSISKAPPHRRLSARWSPKTSPSPPRSPSSSRQRPISPKRHRRRQRATKSADA